MIDLNRHRVIDLSLELTPGELKRDGRYLHGEPLHGRPVEVQEYEAYNARMHSIQGHTHCGTHAEATYKYDEEGADIAAMPVESYLGEAAACDFTGKKPGEAVGVTDFEAAGVLSGDIVLAWGDPGTQPPPYIGDEALDWLIRLPIKLIGIEDLHGPPGTPLGRDDLDGRLLTAGIPFVDALSGLRQISRRRVFFIALPVRMRRVTASWTRAVALEEIE